MPTPTLPRWRQGFDLAEKSVGPLLEAVVRSEPFAIAVGIATRAQKAVRDEAARQTRRWLHALNLPAASDMTRILGEVGRLSAGVRELGRRVEQLSAAAPPDAGAGATAAEHAGEGRPMDAAANGGHRGVTA